MKILLTGAAGRLGGEVSRQLKQAGIDYRATDRIVRKDAPAPIQLADLRSTLDCYRLLQDGIDTIVHLGNHSWANPGDAQKVFSENVAMNHNLFHAAIDLGIRRIIFASSINAMFGTNHHGCDTLPAYLPLDGDAPPNPGNAYGLSKQVGEDNLKYLALRKDITAIALRFPLLLWGKYLHHQTRWLSRMQPGDHYRLHDILVLSYDQAAGCVLAALRAPLTGYHCFFPAVDVLPNLPFTDIIQRQFPNLTLHKPASEFRGLVDPAQLQQKLGWTPAPLASALSPVA